MLVKSGVGKIRIIDYDHISLSGLNQHATATRADVDSSKVIAMKKYFRMIAPWVEVDACVERFQDDSAEHLLSGKQTEMDIWYRNVKRGRRGIPLLTVGGVKHPPRQPGLRGRCHRRSWDETTVTQVLS